MSNYIEAWQELMIEPYPWVLFENGTCVILMKPSDHPAEQEAATLLKNLFSSTGEEFGDYGVLKLSLNKGWIVTSTPPDIVTLVKYNEVPEEYRDDTLSIGSHGKNKRKMDAQACRVIHVADGGMKSLRQDESEP